MAWTYNICQLEKIFTRNLNSFLSRARSKLLENRRMEIFLEKSIRKLEIINLLEDLILWNQLYSSHLYISLRNLQFSLFTPRFSRTISLKFYLYSLSLPLSVLHQMPESLSIYIYRIELMKMHWVYCALNCSK